MKKLACLFALLMTASLLGVAAEPPTGAQRVVPTITRTVQLFSGLENDWIDAVQNRDTAAIKKLLSDNFELRTAAAPGQPTPRDESITRALADPSFASTIEQMAAHEYGNVIVVSFLWKLDVPPSSPLPQRIFVVDTWKQVDGNWQVSARYAAPVDASAKKVPGADMTEPVIKKKI